MLYLEYRLTVQEFKDFTYYTNWRSSEKRTVRLKYYIGNLLLYIFLLTAFHYFSKQPFHPVSFLIQTLFLIPLMIYLRFRVKRYFSRAVGRIIRESGEERILPFMRLSFSEKGITGTTNDSEISFKWDAIFRRATANECYYLYLDSRQAVIVPGRIFHSAGEREKFEKILLTYIPLQAEFSSFKK